MGVGSLRLITSNGTAVWIHLDLYLANINPIDCIEFEFGLVVFLKQLNQGVPRYQIGVLLHNM